MASTIRDVTIRIRIEQVKSPPLKVPGVKQAEAGFKGVNVQVAKLDTSIAKTTSTAEKMGIQIQDSGLKSAEGFRTAGEGVFAFGRGLAFTFSKSDEDFQRMLKNVAAVQGGFDLFKGSIDIIKGTTEGLRAMRTASATAATTNTVLAATNTAVATTAAGATAAMIPILPVVVGVAAAVGGLAVAWSFFKSDAPEAVGRTKDAIDDLNKSLAATVASFSQFESFKQTNLGNVALIQRMAKIEDRRAALRGEELTDLQKISRIEKRREASLKAIQTASAAAQAGAGTEDARRDIQRSAEKSKAGIRLGAKEDILGIRESRQQSDKQTAAATGREQEAEAAKQRAQTLAFGALDPRAQREAIRTAERFDAGQDVSVGAAQRIQRLRPDISEQVFESSAESGGVERVRRAVQGAQEAESVMDELVNVVQSLVGNIRQNAAAIAEVQSQAQNAAQMRQGAF